MLRQAHRKVIHILSQFLKLRTRQIVTIPRNGDIGSLDSFVIFSLQLAIVSLTENCFCTCAMQQLMDQIPRSTQIPQPTLDIKPVIPTLRH